ncbi:MAG: flagellar protein FlgN [Solirubrobacterales bacterium]
MRDITDLLAAFCDSLDRQIELLGRLREVAEQKKPVIISGEVTQLDALMRQENVLLQTLNKTEQQRLREQAELARALGADSSAMTASVLIERVREIDKERALIVKAKVDTLAFHLQGLKTLNNQIAELLEQSLGFIESLEELISGARDTTYQPRGYANQNPNLRGLFDKKI